MKISTSILPNPDLRFHATGDITHTNKNSFMKKVIRKTYVLAIVFTMLNLFLGTSVFSQTTNDYRSATSGTWSTLTTWERYNGTTWVTPTAGQGTPTNGVNVITILSPHVVTISTGITVDQVTIAFGAKLTVNNVTLVIANGAGTDLSVDGTLEVTGGSGALTTTGTLAFNATGTYIHNRNAGLIPTATWNATSTCNVTGTVATAPTVTTFGQSFGNFTWNCPAQTVDFSLAANLVTVNGNFTMTNTNTGSLRLSNSGAADILNIAGSFSQTGGNFFIGGTGDNDWVVNVGSNFSVSGGTFNMSGSTGTYVVNVIGNFTASGGTITETGSGTNTINFSGTAIQIFTSGSTISNVVNFNINTAAKLQMATATTTVTGGGTFNVSAGATLYINSSNGITTAGTATGNIQTTTRTYNVGGNYIYNGTAAQATGTGLPTGLTGSVTIDNVGNTVTLSAAKTIASGGTVNLTNGIFAAASNLTMATTSTINRSAGSLTGTPQGAGLYNVNYTGSTKITGPELNGTGINNVNENLTAGQTLTLGGAINIGGTLTIASGTSFDVSASNFAILIAGSWTNNGGTFTAGTGTVTFDGTGAQSINGTATSQTFNNVIVNKTAATLLNTGGSTTSVTTNALTLTQGNFTAPATLNIGGDFIHTAGTYTAGTNTNVSGNWTRNGGTFTPATNTVTFIGSNAQLITGSNATAFYNLTINKNAAANTVTSTTTAFSALNDVSVSQGNLIIQATNADYSIAGTLSVATNGTFTHSVSWDATSHLLSIGGSLSVDGIFAYTVRSHVTMGGAGVKTIKTGANPASALSILTLTLGTYSANGTVQINDNFYPMYNSTGSFSTNGQSVTAIASCLSFGGSLNVNGGSLNISGGLVLGSGANAGTLTVSSGAFVTDGITLGDPVAGTTASTITQSGGTFTVNGAVTINQPTAAANNAWNINAQTATVSGLINFAGTNTTTTRIGSIVITSGTLNANGGINFTASAAATKLITMSAAAGVINLKGALTVPALSSTLTAGTAGSIFNYADNTAAQTVNYFSAGGYYNLHINTTGGTGATLSAAVTGTNVAGNLRVQTGILNNGGFAITGNAARIFEVANGAFFQLAGVSSTFPTVFGTVTLGATSTVDYRGSGAQIIAAQNYGHLTTTLNGTRTIALANAGTIGIAGIFTPAAGTTSYTNTGSTVSFNGTTGSQNVPAFSFNNLTINNTAGVVLTGSSSVNGGAAALTFTNGKITTGGNVLTLAATATSTTAAAGKYIFGNQASNIGTGTSTETFYIGDATNYTPVTVAFTTAVTTIGALTVFTTPGDHPNIGGSGLNASRSVNRFWTLTNSTIAPIGYSATFNFIGPVGSGDIDAGVTTANLIVKGYNPSTWFSTTNGTRTATSTQASGITAFGDFQVAEATACVAPTINTPVVTNVSCNGNNDGAISITTTGGTSPFTYIWSNGATTQNITGLLAGNYSVVVTATGGCTVSSGTISVSQPAVLNATVTPTNISCNGAADGSIIITTPTGGTGTYEYSINGGTNWQSGGSFTGLGVSTHNVKIRDAARVTCIVTLNGAVSITQPAVLNATVNSTNVNCNGANDGTITITSATGGYGTYQYSINGGANWQSGGSFTSLAPGVRNVQIRDAARVTCVVTLNAALSITQPAVLNATVNSTNINCNGANDGTITITAPSGGYGTYEYSINGGTSWQSSGSFTGLSAAVRNVQIRDAAHVSCVVILNAALSITQPAVLNATVNSANTNCNGANDGTITITSPTGGYGTYEYSINGGTSWQSGGSFTGLGAAVYNVQIRDAAHTTCVVTLNAALAVTQPVALNATVTSTNINCNGANNGTITITSPSGGYGTYEYSINGGTNWQSGGSFTGLGVAFYNVQIRDAAHTSCVVILDPSLSVTQPAVLSATVNATNANCHGSATGSISITAAAGGNGTYEYSINGGTNWQSGAVFSVEAGTYNVQIRDAANTTCILILNAALVITEPVVLNAVNTGSNASCGINDGAIIITSPTGGSGTYEYTINGGINWQTSGNFTGLAAGNYNVQIRDAATPTCVVVLDPSQVINQNSAPDGPISGGNQSVCYNGDTEQTITATATSSATIVWYNASTGGSIVAPPSLTGVGTATYYAQANSGSCVSSTRTAVTLTIQDAPVAPISGGDETVCSNGSPTQTLIATASSPAAITWFTTSTGGSSVTPAQIGVGSTTYYAEASNGTCTSPSRTPVTITINPILATPGTISGPLDVCPLIGSPVPSTYSIAAVSGATFYTWRVPVGTTIVSGQGTTSISVTFDNSFALTNSMFIVTAESSSACTSAASSIEVLKIVPGIPTVINGPADACPFVGQPTNAVYSIDPVANATSYTWSVPANAVLVSGQGTLSIEVSYTAAFTSGSIKVTANSNCGNRAPRSLGVSRLVPVQPAAISGPTDACPFIGTSTPVNYSIVAVDNAISYSWTVPANVTLVSGQGTTSITVTFNSGYVTSAIKVKSVSNCASSGDKSLSVAAATASMPGSISGPTNACPFIGTASVATYSIAAVGNATSYNWSVPAGASITSHPNGSGVNDTIITVSFNTNLVSGSNISVQAVACISSAARTLSVLRTSAATPGIITGSTNACPFMVSGTTPSGIPVLYSIRKVPNTTSYTWSAPSGATITAHPAGSGVNDTTVEVTYSSGFISGTLSVAAVNDCGAGGVRTLAISRLTPGTPGAITIANTVTCPNRQYTYTLASLPSNAISVLWTVPTQGTIVSGQGTTSITVSYTSGAVTGTVTATGYNNCSNSSTRSVNINLAACVGGKAAGKTIVAATGTTSETLQVNVFPNPSVSDFKLRVLTAGKDVIHVRILDMQGREFRKLIIMPYETISIGADLKAGSYLVEVTQGKNKSTQKLLKF